MPFLANFLSDHYQQDNLYITIYLQAQESSNSNLNGIDVEDGVSEASGGSNSPISSQGTTPTPTPTHRPTKLLFEVFSISKVCDAMWFYLLKF